ncbi:GlxA family transcriptional regulator [Actinacidiphila bryophytorum]|uniref:GlxA family transcriptional regulator n=1 Tax=Actinacidiphila bryophytorum TaxID=1436133 RepID=UPI002176980B|nr:helix-turn-helix domain-containing protein [Actinacidiphila bryophytorum]UWE11348.1 helix-turn-helix domain-containing protein [Actinacidiphila bryophytorum]
MGRHRVVALLTAPHSPFELASAAEVFGTARPEVVSHYDFSVCAEQPGAMETTIGYSVLVQDGLGALERAQTVVIPGWQGLDSAASPDVLDALVRAHRRGARVVAICTGAFLLAQTGLLDGRRATTHWRRTALFADCFPAVEVEADVLFVDHGDVATSAGTGAGIDLCLHLVRQDHGAAYATRIARSMVLPPHREGSQLQYAVQDAPRVTDESLAPLLQWAVSHLAEDITVTEMAKQAGLSGRTLARRFREQLGTTPGQWLLRQRLDAARSLLEQTDLPVESVAARVGLSSAVNLRRRFRTLLGTTPGTYRRTFSEPRHHEIPDI